MSSQNMDPVPPKPFIFEEEKVAQKPPPSNIPSSHSDSAHFRPSAPPGFRIPSSLIIPDDRKTKMVKREERSANTEVVNLCQAKLRGFDARWLEMFDFLFYGQKADLDAFLKNAEPPLKPYIPVTANTDMMYCCPCIMHGKSNIFTKGQNRFRKDVLFEHMLTNDHKQAVEDSVNARITRLCFERAIKKNETHII